MKQKKKDTRLTFQYNKEENIHILIIHKATKEDEGKYSMKAKNSVGSVVTSANVRVIIDDFPHVIGDSSDTENNREEQDTDDKPKGLAEDIVTENDKNTCEIPVNQGEICESDQSPTSQTSSLQDLSGSMSEQPRKETGELLVSPQSLVKMAPMCVKAGETIQLMCTFTGQIYHQSTVPYYCKIYHAVTDSIPFNTVCCVLIGVGESTLIIFHQEYTSFVLCILGYKYTAVTG